jgi:hypothetical protein
MSNENPTAAERKQLSKDYVATVDAARKNDGSLSVEEACKKTGKKLSGYYYHRNALAGKTKVIKVKTTRKRRARSNLPAVASSGFTELPQHLRSAGGSGKMLVAVAVGDAAEVTKVLEGALNRFF